LNRTGSISSDIALARIELLAIGRETGSAVDLADDRPKAEAAA